MSIDAIDWPGGLAYAREMSGLLHRLEGGDTHPLRAHELGYWPMSDYGKRDMLDITKRALAEAVALYDLGEHPSPCYTCELQALIDQRRAAAR